MRILLLSPSYQPVLGGLQTVTHQVAAALAQSGHQVRVVTNRYPRSLPADETVDGIAVQRWPFLDSCREAMSRGRMDLAAAGAYYNPVTTIRLKRLAASFRPDVVNLHFPEPRMASILSARGTHPFRLVVSLHGDDVERWFSGPTGEPACPSLVRELLSSADSVTACSQYLLNRAELLEPSIASKATVIHNGVDASRFLQPEAYTHPRPYVFTYGRHIHKKGFDLLLKAFAGVARQVREIDLIVAGAGDETGELHKLRSALDLEQRVVFYGRATPEEIVKLLKGCRLAAIPSREEPFGIAAAEALFSGRPLVATRVGGIPEVARAAGALVEASSGTGAPAVHWAAADAADLERAILGVLSQPAPAVPGPCDFSGLSLARMTRRYLQVLEGPLAQEEELGLNVYAAV